MNNKKQNEYKDKKNKYRNKSKKVDDPESPQASP